MPLPPPLSIQPNAQLAPTQQQPLTPAEIEMQRRRIAAQMAGRQAALPTTLSDGLARVGGAIGDRRAAGVPLDAAPPMFGGPQLPSDYWRS